VTECEGLAPQPGLMIMQPTAPMGPMAGATLSKEHETVTLAAARRPRNLALLGVSLGLMIGAAVVGLPIVAAMAFGGGLLSYGGLVALDARRPSFMRHFYGPLGPPLVPEVQPSDISCSELRLTYSTILQGHDGLRSALDASGGARHGLIQLYGRSTELVQTAGRIARVGCSLKAYLDGSSDELLDRQISHLEERATESHDEGATRVFRQAAAVRCHQLATYHRIEGLYARVEARLAMVVAFLAALEAQLIELEALDLEAEARAGGLISEHLEVLGCDLAMLETSLEGAFD
jgi:hypothetical protein